jgi:hypothetical protein
MKVERILLCSSLSYAKNHPSVKATFLAGLAGVRESRPPRPCDGKSFPLENWKEQ